MGNNGLHGKKKATIVLLEIGDRRLAWRQGGPAGRCACVRGVRLAGLLPAPHVSVVHVPVFSYRFTFHRVLVCMLHCKSLAFGMSFFPA